MNAASCMHDYDADDWLIYPRHFISIWQDISCLVYCKNRLYIVSISVIEMADQSVPAAVSDLTVTPAALGRTLITRQSYYQSATYAPAGM